MASPLQEAPSKGNNLHLDRSQVFSDQAAHPLPRAVNSDILRCQQFAVSSLKQPTSFPSVTTAPLGSTEMTGRLLKRSFIKRAEDITSSEYKLSPTSSSASVLPTSARSRFTLTDTQNKMYPLWVTVTVLGVLAILFLFLCGARWCFFRPGHREDDDTVLTSRSTPSGRKTNLRNGAKSLRKALTRGKLAGASFARRNKEGSVLLEVGDEVYSVPPAIAAEYNQGKRIFGAGGDALSPSIPVWNGKAFLAQCLARHEAKKRMETIRCQSGSTAAHPININAWSRSSCSTLVGLDSNEKDYMSAGLGGEKPKRGLSARIAESLRSLRTAREDEEEDLKEPERTTDLSTFLPTVTKGSGWDIRPQQPVDEEKDCMTYARSSTPPFSLPKNRHALGRKPPRRPDSNEAASKPISLPAAVLTPLQQHSTAQRGFSLRDVPSAEARARITKRAFRRREFQLQQQQEQFSRNRLVPQALRPVQHAQASAQKQQRSPAGLQIVSPQFFQPGQIVAPGSTVPVDTAVGHASQQVLTLQLPDSRMAAPQQTKKVQSVSLSYARSSQQQSAAASVGRDRLREMRAASASHDQKARVARSKTRLHESIRPVGDKGGHAQPAKRSMTTASGLSQQQQAHRDAIRWSLKQSRDEQAQQQQNSNGSGVVKLRRGP